MHAAFLFPQFFVVIVSYFLGAIFLSRDELSSLFSSSLQASLHHRHHFLLALNVLISLKSLHKDSLCAPSLFALLIGCPGIRPAFYCSCQQARCRRGAGAGGCVGPCKAHHSLFKCSGACDLHRARTDDICGKRVRN